MNARPTFDEIVRKANAETAKLEGMIQKINGEIDAIIARGAGQLSAADQAELKKLHQDRKTLTASMRRIALVTLEQLDKTDELQQLVASIRAVRTDLEKRRARIVRFASTAEELGKTLDSVADLAIRIDGIREDVSHLDDPAPRSG
jgi:uncharacterized protein YukE